MASATPLAICTIPMARCEANRSTGHITSYTFDDYRRLKSVTLPARGDGSGTHTTSFYYGANAWDAINDYKYTDSNVT